MLKKRILFVGEASFLSTGFSTIYGELLPLLAESGKYEIAELGSYASADDPRIESFIRGRWKFYAAKPTGDASTNPHEWAVFSQPSPRPRAMGQNTNQFGEWIFDRVVADFKPDIVVDIRDWWMLEFQEVSCFRPWFKWIVMPTVDAEPQKEEWIQTYENADLVLSYSDYGVSTLKRQSVKAKVFPTPMRPGVDLDTFKPFEGNEAREYFAIKEDVPIVGTVMRNQSRKLYPDLIDAFSLMKEKYKGNPVADKAILILHTTWPDNQYSYDYPRHIMRLNSYPWMDYHHRGIKDSVMQSMMCHKCGEKHIAWAMSLFNQPIERLQDSPVIFMPCPHCGEKTATAPTTGGGYSREELSKLYNLFDLYVQCSICEGDGMPIQEAKACGVPTLVPDYTAMREKGRFPKGYVHFEKAGVTESNYTCHLGGEVTPVQRYYYEPETSCKRALPDVSVLADQIFELLSDQIKRKKMSEDARKCVEANYDWNRIWRQWEFVFDHVNPKSRANTWDSPIEVIETVKPQDMPEDLNDDQFLEWLYVEILKYPRIDPNGAQMWKAHLNQGVSREQLLQHFVMLGNQQSDAGNMRQRIRAEVEGITESQKTGVAEDWIE
jgi:glycosyltransferase involved in cell wall biosynthesis